MRKVLFVSAELPGHQLGFQQSGQARYVSSFIDHLTGRGCKVVFLLIRPRVDFLALRRKDLPYKLVGRELADVGDYVVVSSLTAGACAIAWTIFKNLPSRPMRWIHRLRSAVRRSRGYVHIVGRFPNDRDVAAVRRVAATEEPDLVLYDTIFASCGRLADVDHWVLTHDVKYKRIESFMGAGVRVYPDTFDKHCERRILSEAGNAIAIQWDDAAALRELAPGCRTVVVPAVIDAPISRPYEDEPSSICLFVASGSFHNVHGISWFLDECWPQIRRTAPGASLDVIGTVCIPLAGTTIDGVRLLGVVGDIGPYYRRAAVVVVPLRVGSGLKVKIVEAIANHKATVTTPVGAEGLARIEPLPFIVAATAAEFADATSRVLTDGALRRRLAAAAREAAPLFQPAQAFAEFVAATTAGPSGSGSPSRSRTPLKAPTGGRYA